MSIYQIEDHIKTGLISNLEGLNQYLTTASFSNDRRDFHRAIRDVQKNDETLTFHLLGREFLVFMEPLLTQSKGCLKTLMKITDMEKYPNTKWEFLPNVKVYVDLTGQNSLINPTDGEIGSLGEKYIKRLITHITNLEFEQ